MTFFYVSGKDIEIKAKHLLDRFKSALLVKGTEGFHKFVPLNDNRIGCYTLSSDSDCVRHRVRRDS